VESVQSDRLGVATSFAKEHGCTVVLKGANTVVTDGYHSYVDTVANSGMAKGGSGDVLAGMASSYVAQGLAPLEACKLAVYVHSQCGLRCAERLTKYSMLPTDVIDEIPSVLRSLA
jgi:NAD(P)H-hydrate epimerase